MLQKNIGSSQIELVQGDITDQEVDAIVNAANSRLAGGGGVDGAIHRRGGATIMEETNAKSPDGCPTGSAVITAAGTLKARFVIHAVGPIWRGGNAQEPDLLASAYQTSLQLAGDQGCRSVAFPSLSTGAYGYPIKSASRIAISTASQFLAKQSRVELVRFVLFDSAALDVFAAALSETDI